MSSCTENQMVASEEDTHYQYTMQLASASVLPMVLKAAVELGVLEIISRAGPGALLSTSQIASHLPTHNPDAPILLDRILRLLASYSILTVATSSLDGHQLQSLYGLAPVSRYFIRSSNGDGDGDGESLAALLEAIQDKVMIDMWNHTKVAVLEGGLPFNRAYGMNASEYIGKDARYLELFKASMRDYNAMFMKKILEIYKGFEGLKSMVDVGGGDGTILNMIVSKYPTIKAINFDLAPIIEKSSNSNPGIEHVAGDMFVSIPKGDAIFMKFGSGYIIYLLYFVLILCKLHTNQWILHSWDDEHCLKLLKNCYEALPDYGKVIIVDLVVPEAPETSVAVKSVLQFDLFMMNMNPEGKERTGREFESLAKVAGFSSARVICCAYNFSVVEFYKKM